MLLSELEYARPESVEEAVKLLAREDARALAGGQSLVNVMKTRVAAPELVVDLNAIDALRGIADDGGALTIGLVRSKLEAFRAAYMTGGIPGLRCDAVREFPARPERMDGRRRLGRPAGEGRRRAVAVAGWRLQPTHAFTHLHGSTRGDFDLPCCPQRG